MCGALLKGRLADRPGHRTAQALQLTVRRIVSDNVQYFRLEIISESRIGTSQILL